MCVLSINVPIQKKSANLFNDPYIYIYIYIYICIYSTNGQKLNIRIMKGYVISPLLLVLVMEMILCSAEVNTNEITGPSMKALWMT